MTEIPAVCFIEDLVTHLRVSRRTIARLRRCGSFPIRQMPSLDARPRWSGVKVREFINSDEWRVKLRRAG